MIMPNMQPSIQVQKSISVANRSASTGNAPGVEFENILQANSPTAKAMDKQELTATCALTSAVSGIVAGPVSAKIDLSGEVLQSIATDGATEKDAFPTKRERDTSLAVSGITVSDTATAFCPAIGLPPLVGAWSNWGGGQKLKPTSVTSPALAGPWGVPSDHVMLPADVRAGDASPRITIETHLQTAQRQAGVAREAVEALPSGVAVRSTEAGVEEGTGESATTEETWIVRSVRVGPAEDVGAAPADARGIALTAQIVDQLSNAWQKGSAAPGLVTEMSPGSGPSNSSAPASGQDVLKALRFELRPGELGAVSVRLSLGGNELSLHMSFANGSTADLARSDREALVQALTESGLPIAGLVIDTAGSGRSDQVMRQPEGGGGTAVQGGSNGSGHGGQGNAGGNRQHEHRMQSWPEIDRESNDHEEVKHGVFV